MTVHGWENWTDEQWDQFFREQVAKHPRPSAETRAKVREIARQHARRTIHEKSA